MSFTKAEELQNKVLQDIDIPTININKLSPEELRRLKTI